jgi:hypothetical protein
MQGDHAMLDPDRRERAEAFLAQNLRRQVTNPQPRPHWIGTADRFWYRHETGDGAIFTVVEAASGAAAPAFDHGWLADVLSSHGIAATPRRLPIADLDLTELPVLRFRLDDGRWMRAGGVGGLVAEAPPPALRPGEVAAPRGPWAAVVRGHDLWLRDPASEEERRLTSDGSAHHAWAKSPDMNLTTVTLQRRGITLPANVQWSPDGTKLFTSRLDERDVLDLPLVQHVPDRGGPRPVLHRLKFALTGDAHLPVERHAVFDVETGRRVECDAGPFVTGMTTCIEKEEAWWSADSRRVFFLDRDRYWRRLSLWEFDAVSGASREIHRETAATFIDNNLSVLGLPNIRVLDGSGCICTTSPAER